MAEIEMGKEYKTRDGKPVRILCTGVRNPAYPVLALACEPDGTECILSLTADGRYYADPESEYKLDIFEDTPWSDFKIDEPVMVGPSPEYGWIPVHFAGVRDGKPTTWKFGGTSWTSNAVNEVRTGYQCRRPTAEELKTLKNRHKS